jgi:hypothetical protein
MSSNQAAPEHSTSLTVDASIDQVFSASVATLEAQGFEVEMAEREAGYVKASQPYEQITCLVAGECVRQTMLVSIKAIDGTCSLTVSPRNERVLPNGSRTTSGMGMTSRLVDLARRIASQIKTAAERS